MRYALFLAFAFAAMLVLTESHAAAAGRRRGGAANKHATHGAAIVQPPLGAPNKQAAIGLYGRAVYPKYYWGFHAREFQNLGTPHGDQGIRGNTFQWQPW